MSIADKIARLTSARNGIRTALAAKGVSASTHGFEDFAADIGSISGGAAEPYIEYTYDASGNMIAAKLYGCTRIEPYQFYSQEHLASVDFSESPNLASIGDYAFADCTALDLTSLPEGLTSIGRHAFDNCTALALTSLPEDLTNIGSNAFANCTSLALTSLPRGLTSIGSSAFSNCISIALTSLPEGITSIGGRAFDGCTSLINMEVRCNTLGTGTGIFTECTGLEKVWLRNSCATVTASSATNAPFAECSTDLQIYAEPSSKPDGWGTYFNRTGSSGGTTVAVTYGQTTRPW